MKKGEVEAAMTTLCDKWAKEEKQPWPPDGKYHYSFSQFWSWLENQGMSRSLLNLEPRPMLVDHRIHEGPR
jgi:hypothetical protein